MMTADTPSPLVPKLRFPEFCSTGDWRFQPLSAIAELISERVGTSKCVPMSVTTGVGLLSQEEKFGRTIAGNSYKNYIRLKTNDFAYNKSATKEFPQGYIARYSGTRNAAVPNSMFTCFRPDTAVVIPEYLDHLLHGNHHGRWLRKYITVGARAHGALSVSDDALMSMPVPLPPVAVSHPEQQKIADCLGSLDDLVTAKARKIEALRQHKQGLMQQLFLQPSETVPRLRFPEFQDAGDWMTKILDKQGNFLSSLAGKTAKDFDTGDAAFIPYMNVFVNTFTNILDLRSVNVGSDESQNAVAKGDVFFTISSEIPDEAGMSSVLLEEIENCYLNSFCALFRFDDGKSPNPVFLGFLLRSTLARAHLSRGAQGATRYNISKATFRNLPLQLPSGPEQQKIADCLGSLDDLIMAEGRKLEALRQHKQGLMQQLFPSQGRASEL